MFDQCVFFNLASLTRRVTKIWQNEFEMIGLFPSHAYLLFAIAVNPGATQKDLSEIMELDASTIARFAQALLQKKLIKKKGSGKGGSYALTRKGTKLTHAIDKKMNDLSKNIRSILGKREFHDLTSQLQQTRMCLD